MTKLIWWVPFDDYYGIVDKRGDEYPEAFFPSIFLSRQCGDFFKGRTGHKLLVVRNVDSDPENGEPSFVDVAVEFTNDSDAVLFKLRFHDELGLMTAEQSAAMTRVEMQHDFDCRVEIIQECWRGDPADLNSLYEDGEHTLIDARGQGVTFTVVNGCVTGRVPL